MMWELKLWLKLWWSGVKLVWLIARAEWYRVRLKRRLERDEEEP